MKRIKINKSYIEDFLNDIKSDFDKLKQQEIKNFGFDEFKKYFCNDELVVNDNYIGEVLDKKKKELFKKIYKNISESNSQFWKKVRQFIISTFTQQIKFCPYCGKVPLVYFEQGKGYRRLFQLDHFFPKNVFPSGIINFYNLIPSCNACNHLKLDDNPLDVISNGGEIFHPYFGNLYLENGKIVKGNKNYIELDYNSSHSKYFKLGQKYLNDQETFNIFQFIYEKYTQIKEEYSRFKENSKSIEEFVEYFLKNYYPEKEQEILKYSNGKLKKDLIENMKIILENDLKYN